MQSGLSLFKKAVDLAKVYFTITICLVNLVPPLIKV